MWGWFSGGKDIFGVGIGIDKLVDSEGRVKFDKVDHTELDKESGSFLLDHEWRWVDVAVIINFGDEFEHLVIEVMQLIVFRSDRTAVGIYKILQSLDGFGYAALWCVYQLWNVLKYYCQCFALVVSVLSVFVNL